MHYDFGLLLLSDRAHEPSQYVVWKLRCAERAHCSSYSRNKRASKPYLGDCRRPYALAPSKKYRDFYQSNEAKPEIKKQSCDHLIKGIVLCIVFVPSSGFSYPRHNNSFVPLRSYATNYAILQPFLSCRNESKGGDTIVLVLLSWHRKVSFCQLRILLQGETRIIWGNFHFIFAEVFPPFKDGGCYCDPCVALQRVAFSHLRDNHRKITSKVFPSLSRPSCLSSSAHLQTSRSFTDIFFSYRISLRMRKLQGTVFMVKLWSQTQFSYLCLYE